MGARCSNIHLRFFQRIYSLAHIFLAVLLLGGSTCAQTKSALVLGTSRALTPTIPNDATAMAETLRQLGFQVILENDASKARITKLLSDWSATLKDGGVALFYYAGHGAQINGVNYLRPAGSTLSTLDDIKTSWVNLDEVFGVLNVAPSPTRFVFLDACRDDPIVQNLAAADTDGDVWKRGLAEPQRPPRNTLISFATSPGDIASDEGLRPHSPYTAALLKYIGQAGLSIDELFRDVGTYVEGATFDGQTPWINSSFRPLFYFREPAYIVGVVQGVDDELLVQLNDVNVLSSGTSPASGTRLPLKVGHNLLSIMVYNQHTFTPGVDLSEVFPNLPPGPGHLPEGWHYTLALQSLTGDPITKFTACEDRPQKNGPHHGHLFVTATADIVVDSATGQITVASRDDNAWQRDEPHPSGCP